jgi:hypothetical protein
LHANACFGKLFQNFTSMSQGIKMNKQLFKFFQKTRFGLLSALLAATLLSIACGGGGGGGGDVASGTGQIDGNGNPVVPGGTTPPVNAGLLDPSIVSRPGEGGNDAPKVAIDAAGNAISIWRRQVSSFPFIYELVARRYVVGSGWQAVESLAIDDPSDAVREIQQPIQLSMNPTTGAAMAVWVEKRESSNPDAAGLLTSNVMARAYNPTTGWGTARIVDNDQPMLRSDVALAMDANGNAMAVWSRYVDLSVPVYASRYTESGGWSAPTRIENSNEIGIGGSGMLVTFLSNGNALAVWNTARTGGGTGGGVKSAIWGNQYTVGSGWGTNAVVMSYTNDLSLGGARALAADANGNAVLTFEHQLLVRNPVRYELNLWSKRYSGGAWGADSTAQPVGVPYNCTNCPSVYGGNVQINAQGEAVATWELRNANNKSVIWGARSSNGGPWVSSQLNENIAQFTQSGEFSQVGVDDQGNARVVWSAVDELTGDTNINFSRYTVGAGWATTGLLEDYNTTSSRPQIAMNSRGNAMTVWLLFDNTLGTVIAGRYSSGR